MAGGCGYRVELSGQAVGDNDSVQASPNVIAYNVFLCSFEITRTSRPGPVEGVQKRPGGMHKRPHSVMYNSMMRRSPERWEVIRAYRAKSNTLVRLWSP